MKKFILGPLQEKWLQQLEQHPEKQMTGQLGLRTENVETYCCLGMALVCIADYLGEEPIFKDNGGLVDFDGSEANIGTLEFSYSKIGLWGTHGDLQGEQGVIRDIKFGYLTEANDNGVTWPEIAAFIRANPEKVFKESK